MAGTESLHDVSGTERLVVIGVQDGVRPTTTTLELSLPANPILTNHNDFASFQRSKTVSYLAFVWVFMEIDSGGLTGVLGLGVWQMRSIASLVVVLLLDLLVFGLRELHPLAEHARVAVARLDVLVDGGGHLLQLGLQLGLQGRLGLGLDIFIFSFRFFLNFALDGFVLLVLDGVGWVGGCGFVKQGDLAQEAVGKVGDRVQLRKQGGRAIFEVDDRHGILAEIVSGLLAAVVRLERVVVSFAIVILGLGTDPGLGVQEIG